MIRIGMIGCGTIVKYRHAPQAAENPSVEIAGFFDANPEKSREMTKLYGGTAYAEVGDMLADAGVDAVMVCTPNFLHAEHTISALNAGKHVMCEKPMATSVSEAQAMIAAAKKSGKNLMIGHGLRFSATHKAAKALLDSGKMGRILSFKCTFGHAGPEQWSKESGPNIWFFDRKMSSGGSVLDLGIHNADILGWFLKDSVAEVKAMTSTVDKRNSAGELIGVDDNAVCLLRTRGGICGTLTTSWTYYGYKENSFEVYCKGGVVRVYSDDKSRMIATGNDGETIEKCEAAEENQNVLDIFAEDIIKGRKPTITGEDGMAALKIILACAESAKTEKGIMI